MIIRGSLFVFAKVVVGRGTQKICDRYFRKKFSPRVQCSDGERVVPVLIGSKGEVAIRFAEVRFEFHRGEEFVLGLGKLLLPHQSLTEAAMKLGIVRRRGNQGTVGGLSPVVFSGGRIQIGQLSLCPDILWRKLCPRFEFRDRFFVLAFRRQHASALRVSSAVVGAEGQQFTQKFFSLVNPAFPHVNIGQASQCV